MMYNKNYKREFLQRFKTYFPLSMHPIIVQEEEMYKLKFLNTEICISSEEDVSKEEDQVHALLYKKAISVIEGMNISATYAQQQKFADTKRQAIMSMENKMKNIELKSKIHEIAQKTMNNEDIKVANKELQKIIKEKQEMVQARQKIEKVDVLKEQEKENKIKEEKRKIQREAKERAREEIYKELRKEVKDVLDMSDSVVVTDNDNDNDIKKDTKDIKNTKDTKKSKKKVVIKIFKKKKEETNLLKNIYERNSFTEEKVHMDDIFKEDINNNVVKEDIKDNTFKEEEKQLKQLDVDDNIDYNTNYHQRRSFTDLNLFNNSEPTKTRFFEEINETLRMDSDSDVKILGGVLADGSYTPTFVCDEKNGVYEFMGNERAWEYLFDEEYKEKMIDERGFDILKEIKKESGVEYTQDQNMEVLRNEDQNKKEVEEDTSSFLSSVESETKQKLNNSKRKEMAKEEIINLKSDSFDSLKNLDGKNDITLTGPDMHKKHFEYLKDNSSGSVSVIKSDSVIKSVNVGDGHKKAKVESSVNTSLDLNQNNNQSIDKRNAIDRSNRTLLDKIIKISANKKKQWGFAVSQICQLYSLNGPEYEITRQNDVFICEATFYKNHFSSSYEYNRDAAKEGVAKKVVEHIEKNLERIVEMDEKITEMSRRELFN